MARFRRFKGSRRPRSKLSRRFSKRLFRSTHRFVRSLIRGGRRL